MTRAPKGIPAEAKLSEIPRRRLSNGKEGGPYVILPGHQRSWGTKRCETCGRMVEPDRAHPRKGKCKCHYYQRTTTFIDVLQDEYLLKMWGNRNVAWGMSQRPDLILSAATCRPDSDDDQPLEDKTTLNNVVREAQKVAADMAKATIGTSLHKLTHKLDRGETLGFIPDPWPGDIRAYEECCKAEGVEWVDIESFRVFDDWVSKTCKHVHPQNKDFDPEHPCRCRGVAGTVDRIGWYRGRLTIFDIKTGSTFNKMGHAMQLAMYARMVPYIIATDERAKDKADINLDVGYIIELPEGEGTCKFTPMDIMTGWGACRIAKQVWTCRDQVYDLADNDPVVKSHSTFNDMAARASSRTELNMLWRNAKESFALTPHLKKIMHDRAAELDAQAEEVAQQ
jgi:hypothetical protein